MQQAEDRARAPACCCCWAQAGPPPGTSPQRPRLPRPSGPVAHLARPQCPTEHPPAWAATGCCAAAHMGTNGSPAGSTGEHSRFRRLQHAWGMLGPSRQPTGSWTGFRTVSTVHQAHPLPVFSLASPRPLPVPAMARDGSGHSHGGPRILRGYAYHPRDNENIQRRWHHVGPLLFARCKTWLLQNAGKCWARPSVIW